MYKKLGPIGHYGASTDKSLNDLMIEVNKLVDEYNSKINTFETEQENLSYSETMLNKILETLNYE